MSPDLIKNMENLTFEFPTPAPAHGQGPGRWSAEQWRCLALQFEELHLGMNRENIKEFFTRENLKALALVIAKKLVTNVFLRAISSYILSFLGILSILSWQNPIPWYISVPVAAGLAVAVSILFTISVTFRCVIILSMPQFTTQQGRFVLLFIVSALLLGGPLVSLTYNMNQAAYSLSCMANMTARQGKAMTDSYVEAYHEMTNSVNRTVNKIKQAKTSTDAKMLQYIDDIHEKVASLKSKVQAELDNCNSIMNLAREDCMYRSSIAYNNCIEVTSGARLDFFCKLVKIAPGICDNGFSGLCFPVSAVTLLAREIDRLAEKLQEDFRFKLSYENKLNNHVNSSLNDTVVQESIRNVYQDFYEVAAAFVITIKYILFGAIFLIPFRSWMYLRRFLSKNRREISFLDRYPIFNERQRQREFLLQILMLLIHFVLTLAVYSFDWILYWIEATVEENGSVTFETEGEIGFSLDLRLGDGLFWLNPFFDRELFESLDMEMQGRHKFFTSTVTCLPTPMVPSGVSFILPVCLIYVLTILFLVTGNKFLKRRGDIILYFFPNELNRHNQNLIPFSA